MPALSTLILSWWNAPSRTIVVLATVVITDGQTGAALWPTAKAEALMGVAG
jgi:hypothetical protein